MSSVAPGSAADPLEGEKVRDGAARAGRALATVGAVIGISAVVLAVIHFISAASAGFSLYGHGPNEELLDYWDWWRGGWILAAGLYVWALLYGLSEVLHWLSWRADEHLPIGRFRDSDTWDNKNQPGV